MFDVGGGELILVVLAVLLLFGPKKLPEIAQMVGKGMQQVRKAQAQFQVQINEIKTELNDVGTDHQRNLRNATPVRRDQESADKKEIEKPDTESNKKVESNREEVTKNNTRKGQINTLDTDAGQNEANTKDKHPDDSHPDSGTGPGQSVSDSQLTG